MFKFIKIGNSTIFDSGSHQAPMLNGYAAAWRQQVQVRFYGVYFLHISNTDKSWQHTLKIVKQQ